MKYPTTVDVGGETGNVWVSEQMLTHDADTLELS